MFTLKELAYVVSPKYLQFGVNDEEEGQNFIVCLALLADTLAVIPPNLRLSTRIRVQK